MKISRLKTNIWQGGLSLAVAVIALSLGSCTKDPLGQGGQPGGDGIEVRVSFAQSAASKAATRAPEVGTPEEDRLDFVTILVFNKDGSKLETVLTENVSAGNATVLGETQPKWASDQILLVKPVIMQSEPKVIYAIANWSQTKFDKATYTEGMLKAELTTITSLEQMNGINAYPMLMSGSESVENLATTAVTVDMARQAAKIKAVVTLKKEVQKAQPNIEWLFDQMKITAGNIPNKSYIIGNGTSPEEITWLKSAEIPVVKTNVTKSDPTPKEDLVRSESIYITENPIRDNELENLTYIRVQLPYKDRTTGVIQTDNYYKLLVIDPSADTSPHKVLRNTIYNFKINIIGLGLPLNYLGPNVNIDDALTVNDWELGEIGDVVDGSQKQFSIDRTSMEFQINDKLFTSTIVTDVADWKLVSGDTGETLFSFAEGKKEPFTNNGITYTLSGTATAATITVVNDETLRVDHTQNMYFIAKNLKVPFTVSLDNGFIPNWVLKDKGWPEDRLPLEGGLQLAKRGNKVYPSGVAEEKDPKMSWADDTDVWVIDGTERVEAAWNPKKPKGQQFGMGQVSTDAITYSTIDKTHSAALYCREMGPEWYLPSMAELNLITEHIREYNSKLSYSFNINLDNLYYWSSTQVIPSNSIYSIDSWLVFNKKKDGYPYSYENSYSEQHVRCVKGTIPLVDSSYIPTSILEAEGWPKDRLPKTGLQVATRGMLLNQGATPEDSDAERDWKMNITLITGDVESVTDYKDAKLGMGLSNAIAIKKAQPSIHEYGTASSSCHAMGPEWYLPSVAELRLIYKYKDLELDGSYKILNSLYWSSTEQSADSAWTVNFQEGGSTQTNVKLTYGDSPSYRCVREI